MARKPMVTRTIVTTKATVMCVNIQLGETFTKVVTVPRTYKNDEALMKKVRELVENENERPVCIVDKTEIETLYGMSEDKFIENAEVLPPRVQ